MKERPWNEDPSKPYSISFWGENPTEESKPGEMPWRGGNDTCWMSSDFATEKEARLAMADLDTHFHKSHKDIRYILLDGPGIHEITCRTEVLKRVERERERDDKAWQREIAMEAGMSLGIQGYNDAMGYDSEEYNYAMEEDRRDREEWERDQRREWEAEQEQLQSEAMNDEG